ncbi:MAG: hypothetical protein WDM90_12600 [Ferruginibacter sp.]
MHLHKKTALLAALLFILKIATAQSGNFTATVTSAESYIKPVTVSFTKPAFKFDNPHGYWFLNPHNGYKHFNTQPDQGYGDRKEELSGIGFISFNQTENDFDVYDLNDSISIQLQKGKNIITAPKYDPKIGDKNKPLHIHINSITASEISFTLSGTAALSSTEGYAAPSFGTITGNGHFYREAQYAKSDPLPGCDCDATIYASVLDDANEIRTPSACEKAFNNKLFDAVQKSMAPLYPAVKADGNIQIVMLPGAADISGEAKDRPYCSSDYYHNGLTGIDAHKNLFSNDDRFGLRFIRMPSSAEMSVNTSAQPITHVNVASGAEVLKGYRDDVLAKKITEAEYNKKVADYISSMSQTTGTGPDMKKLEAENNLYITIIINATNKTETDLKLADKNNTVVTHNVKGAAFEIYSPMIKDNDGSWLNSREGIYFGKFTAPVSGNNGPGFNIKSTTTTYPPNANKLSVYNIIIKMQGGKDLIDKAIANIDFNALQSLITK